MPAKGKDAGPPPSKPKPEEMIDEFKEKFETFKGEIVKENENLQLKLDEIKDSRAMIAKSLDANHKQFNQNLESAKMEINNNIELKFDELQKEIKTSFINLEQNLTEGPSFHYIQILIPSKHCFQGQRILGALIPSLINWKHCWTMFGAGWKSLRRRRETI